jgi:tetrahydromethanopterin:alpha-L-glutamate ligase
MSHSADNLATKSAISPTRIALVGDRDWHTRQLALAFAARGARAVLVKLEDCRFETGSASGLTIAGFDETLPDAVIVRTLSGGSFEAVTLRLGMLHALREIGVPVWNDARAIERCVDKSTTSFLLARAGLPTPETWTTEKVDAARAIVQRETARGPLVLKPLFGSQGRNLRLVRGPDDLPDPAEVRGVYYLQRFVGVERDGGFHDFRVLVSQGRPIAAMIRHSAHWVTNVKRGGKPAAVVLDVTMKELAVRAAAAVGADFAGVDILYDAEARPTVLEVNSMPAWSGLQKVTAINIASVLAADLIATLGRHARSGATE